MISVRIDGGGGFCCCLLWGIQRVCWLRSCAAPLLVRLSTKTAATGRGLRENRFLLPLLFTSPHDFQHGVPLPHFQRLLRSLPWKPRRPRGEHVSRRTPLVPNHRAPLEARPGTPDEARTGSARVRCTSRRRQGGDSDGVDRAFDGQGEGGRVPILRANERVFPFLMVVARELTPFAQWFLRRSSAAQCARRRTVVIFARRARPRSCPPFEFACSLRSPRRRSTGASTSRSAPRGNIIVLQTGSWSTIATIRPR